MLAAASPLPRDDTTPPVMKMYFGVRPSMFVIGPADPASAGSSTRLRGRQQPPHLFQVFRGIDAERFVAGFHGFYPDAMLERAQLLERFRPFERRRLERG